MLPSSLRLGDLRWLPRIAGVLAVRETLGRRLPLPRLARLLEGAPRAAAHAPSQAEIERVVWFTQGVLARIYGRDFCHPRSLVLFHMLSRWGLPVELCFGVRRKGDRLDGHAWLELNGTPLAEPNDPSAHYQMTYSYSSIATRSSYEAD